LDSIEVFVVGGVSSVGRVEVGENSLDPFSGVGLSNLESGFLVLGEGFGNSSLGGEGFGSLLLVGFVGLLGSFSNDASVGVESVHLFSVLNGVLLLYFVGAEVGFNGVDNGLDFVGVDDSGEVSVGHGGSQ